MLQDNRGFSLLELLVVCSIVAILAGMAVPKITQVMAGARSARIEADLTTIDAAIVMYQNDMGKAPTSLDDMKAYLNDADKLQPPVGDCMLRDGKVETIAKDTAYTIKSDSASSSTQAATVCRAYCGSHTAGDFGK